MSDSLRIRLEFRRFDRELRNSLLSFKRNETKDVKSLESLIRERFQLRQPFCLNIDDFVLQQTEPIEILRDNDLIVVEPIFTASETVIKIEPKQELRENQFPTVVKKPKVKTSSKINTSNTAQSEKVKRKRSYNKKDDNIVKNKKHKSSSEINLILDSESSSDSKTNHIKDKANHSKNFDYITQIDHQLLKKVAKNYQKIENKVQKEIDLTLSEEQPNTSTAPEVEIFTTRETPMRRAFLSAATKNKKPIIPKRTPNPNTEKKPNRKRLTQEARDPIDEMSPYIILERIEIPSEINSTSNHIDINHNQLIKKQSARKSFPSPVDPIPKKPIKNGNEVIVESVKTIDYNNCEPLAETPKKGDIIAFKILTLSKNGIAYETSDFNIGSVIHVNEDTSMVDILLQNTIQKRNSKYLINNKKSEELHAIHSIKINWSTVLEPKIIQRSSPST